jgi:menaquinone-9 beta-reductase
MDWDVVVVGAGLAGSGLAAALGAGGWRVLLVEAGALPRHKVCGEFLSPESQASLRSLGLLDAVRALGPVPIGDALMCGREGATLRTPLPGTALGVSRYALDAALAHGARDAGATLWTHTSATAIKPTAHGVRVALRTSDGLHTVDARAVVLACGRHPARALRPRDDAKPRPTWVGVKAHFEGIAMPRDVEVYLFDGGYVGVSPVEGGRVNVCALVRRDVFEGHGGAAGALLALARRNAAFGRRVADGTLLPPSAVAVAPVDTGRPSAPWQGVARIGDAATMIPPLCGDGQAMALRSAELCARTMQPFLQGHCSVDEWERAYRAAWHAEFDGRLRVGRRLQSVLGMPRVGDALLRAGAFFPGTVGRIVRATRGVAPSYGVA